MHSRDPFSGVEVQADRSLALFLEDFAFPERPEADSKIELTEDLSKLGATNGRLE